MGLTVPQKIFGSSAPTEQVGVIGSLAAGAKESSKDLETIQSNSRFLEGLNACVIAGASPAIEDINALFYLLTSQIAALQRSGVNDYNPNLAYLNADVVVSDDVLFSCEPGGAAPGENPHFSGAWIPITPDRVGDKKRPSSAVVSTGTYVPVFEWLTGPRQGIARLSFRALAHLYSTGGVAENRNIFFTLSVAGHDNIINGEILYRGYVPASGFVATFINLDFEFYMPETGAKVTLYVSCSASSRVELGPDMNAGMGTRLLQAEIYQISRS